MRMSDEPQDMEFAGDSFHISHIGDLLFFENFDGHTLGRRLMHSKFDLAESSLADGFK